MDESRAKLLEKQQKKVDSVIETLQLLMDAEKFRMMNTGDSAEIVFQIDRAIKNLSMAAYNMQLAEAAAEGEEIVGQMRADLDRMAGKQEEEEEE